MEKRVVVMEASVPDQVLFKEIQSTNGKRIAVATLNVEKALNAISLEMVTALQEQLTAWENDINIACVFLQGAGEKAFCAGGDIRKLYESMVTCGKGENLYAVDFFSQEYRLNYHIHTYSKPIIVWAAGIIMGGGLGLSAGASHRVVTDSTRMAMPETTIGLYPDVGGTWFLNKAPGRTGLFLGLTGVSINASDAITVGLADYILEVKQRESVLKSLVQLEWSDQIDICHKQVSALLKGLEVEGPENHIDKHYQVIQDLTSASSVVKICQSIMAYDGDDQWLRSAAKTIQYACPGSLHLVYEQLNRGKKLTLKEVFQYELILSINAARLGNFQEGVRALLIDKDRSPKFNPEKLEDVTVEFTEQHFVNPWAEGVHPLAML